MEANLERKRKLAKRIEELTMELVNVRSVVGTKDENDISDKIFEMFSAMPYWKKHPHLLTQLPFINDSLGRSSVMVRISGELKENDKTIVLIGHTDTVGISDYGDLRKYATEPAELKKALQKLNLSEDIKKDIESDDYIFGRGILDMKCGVAAIIAVLEDLSERLDEWSGNIVFCAVGDEEGNSGGMLSFVPELARLQESESYDYQAVLDTDYVSPRFDGDDNKYIYIGTVGKLMPSFYVLGKETHVGQPFNGLDPTQIAGAIIMKINKNIAYSDVVEGEVSLPPITLQHRDLKSEYSVQIARAVNLYFNYATHNSTPDQVMQKMLKASYDAFNDVVGVLNERYDVFCKASHIETKPLTWKARVMSYQDLYAAVYEERGEELVEILESYKEEMLKDPTIDERLFSQYLVQAVHNLWSDKDPIVIVYFSPPYYPHNYVSGETEKGQKLIDTLKTVVTKHKGKTPIVGRKFYPYISDLSFASAPSPERIATLKNNMPAFGSRYNLPIEDMQKLSLPVANIGPFGKDAHQFTERIEKDYSFRVVPTILYETILKLLEE
ncbi:MAG: M20/M25/M40 family metallo-hydrolase [Clostridia bacterium]|nr:M20/M25/M40 family metallo-hydrolase [Clostridia bacterium]